MIKTFTKQNFKTCPLWIRLFIMTFMLFAGACAAFADGSAGGPKGVYLNVNGTNTWYNVYSTYWKYNPSCSGWNTFKSATSISGKDLGTVTTLQLKGYAVIGWTNNSDWVSGELRYQINSGSYTYFKVGNWDSGSSAANVQCTSGDDRVVGLNNQSVNLLTGLTPGNHTIKFMPSGRMRYNGGNFNPDSHPELSAKFTVPGYSTTTGSHSFGEVDLGSQITQTIDLTHYGSDNNATVSITGMNKSEFTATIAKNGNNQQTLTVTFKPTSVAQNKIATITVTDAYDKTYTLNVTGTGKQSCVNVEVPNITSDSPICLGSELTLTLNERQEGVTYKIDNQEIFAGNDNTYSFTPQASGSLTVVASHDKACNGTTNQIVIQYTVNALPSAPFEGVAQSATICEGSEFSLDVDYTWYTSESKKETVSLPVSPTETTTYYITTTTNGCESATVPYTIIVKEQLTKPILDVTNVTQCGSDYTEGKIVISDYNDANTYVLKKGNDVISKTYNAGYSISELETGTYKVEVSKTDACEATSDDAIIEVVNNTPTVSVFEISQTSACENNPITLSYDGTTQSGTISYAWYEVGSQDVLGTENTLTIPQAKNATYKLVVTVTNNECSATDEATTTVEPKAVPSAPEFDSNEMYACVDQPFTLPLPNNLKYEEQPLWTVDGQPIAAANITLSEPGDYTYTAYKNDGCPSQGTAFTVHVNPLPTISISGSEEAVLYEDVVLTATGSDIDEVNWTITDGPGTLSNTTGTSVKLTSSTAGTVKVKATATSEYGCTKESNELSVTFSAEICNNVTDMTKIYLDVSKNTGFVTESYAYVSVTGSSNGTATCSSTSGADQGSYKPKSDTWWGQMTKVSGETNIYEITIPNDVKITKGTTKLSFWNKKINGYNDVYQVQAILGQVISSSTNCLQLTADTKTHNNSRQSDFYCGTWVTYANSPQISAPAVKTVSVTTSAGEGDINFTGQIVKTGCDNSLTYGFEYKTQGDANWTAVTIDTNQDKEAGFTFTDNSIKELDGTYIVRAFITNDNSTQYGAEYTIEPTTAQTPVTKADIFLTDAEGTLVSNDKKYCIGETAYIKVQSDVKYNTIQWSTDNGTEIVSTKLINLYQFTVSGNDNISAMVGNKYNTTSLVETNQLVVSTFSDPSLPTVSLNKISICSNDEVGATVKLTNVVQGQTYQLYQQVDNGNGTFTEQAIGSAKTQTDAVTNETALVLHNLNNTAQSGRYIVKTNTAECPNNLVSTQAFTFTIVDASSVNIDITPKTATTTPWMPLKLTVSATDTYTITVPDGVEYSQNGNVVSVKIPLPDGATGGEGQYENVAFPQGAVTSYTVTANLATTGGEDNPCASPATITLTPYVEECTIGH